MTNIAKIANDLKNLLEYRQMMGLKEIPISKNSRQMKPDVPKSEISNLAEIRAELGDCTRCKLHEQRNNLVFGDGNPDADLMFVGEGPGFDEDKQGIPFVGRAGQLLTKIIEAMKLKRQDVYIANVVKCRPPGNRNPEPDEMDTCFPFLEKQIAAIRPKAIICLGKFAAQTLLKTATPISRLRGKMGEYNGIPVMPTYHPAFLLRNPDAKKQVWEDVQQVMKILNK